MCLDGDCPPELALDQMITNWNASLNWMSVHCKLGFTEMSVLPTSCNSKKTRIVAWRLQRLGANFCWICALSRTSLADGCRSLSYKVVFNRGVTCKALIYSDLWSAVAKSLNSLYCDSLYFRHIFLWVSNECTDFFFSCVGHAKQFEDLRFRDTH